MQHVAVKTLLELQSRFGNKALKFQAACPQNGTAVLKGLKSRGMQPQRLRHSEPRAARERCPKRTEALNCCHRATERGRGLCERRDSCRLPVRVVDRLFDRTGRRWRLGHRQASNAHLALTRLLRRTYPIQAYISIPLLVVALLFHLSLSLSLSHQYSKTSKPGVKIWQTFSSPPPPLASPLRSVP